MLSILRNKVRVGLALGLLVGSFAINTGAQTPSVPRFTTCEFNQTTQITTCDSFGSSAGYYRFQCNTSGSCWVVRPLSTVSSNEE